MPPLLPAFLGLILVLAVLADTREDEVQVEPRHLPPQDSQDTAARQQTAVGVSVHAGLLEWQRFWGSLVRNVQWNVQKAFEQGRKFWPDHHASSPSAALSSEEKHHAVMSVTLTADGRHPQALTLSPQAAEEIEPGTMMQCQNPDFFSWEQPQQNVNNKEPHIGMVFDVYHSTPLIDNNREVHINSVVLQDMQTIETMCDAEFAARYQLLEPLNLRLGESVKHAMDFAYLPVLADRVEPVVSHQSTQSSTLSRLTATDHSTVTNGDSSILNHPQPGANHGWWQWWIPWHKLDEMQDHSSSYRMHSHAFAGGSHGEVWRGCRRFDRRYTNQDETECEETLIFKRLKIENGYRVLEAGLREVYFGRWLSAQAESVAGMYTAYVDHFFRERNNTLELWIVFEYAGRSLRSFLYTGSLYGDYVVYQHSLLWTQLRMSVSNDRSRGSGAVSPTVLHMDEDEEFPNNSHGPEMVAAGVGKSLMRDVLRQILQAAAHLHSNGIVHRDIKPSNVMCFTNIEWDDVQVLVPDTEQPVVECKLGDLSSAWNRFSHENLYTGGPSRLEQTDEYAPPEALFGTAYTSSWLLSPVFDSWSIGIVALELLLGTPNVFSVDHRTKHVLTHRMRKKGATEKEIERALYLAALSQFCIYRQSEGAWPLRQGDPLHKSNMVKQSCTLNDFQRALHARDPLGIGFDASPDAEKLLHLIWQLLTWDPKERMTASEALRHPYFNDIELWGSMSDNNALESQMLDPRMDMKVGHEINEFVCPKCKRKFNDWFSCRQHARGRKHANFCTYEKESLPTCLNAHTMLPAHSTSGHCDIRGRRRYIEDFHTIQLLPDQQFYGIFDGHSGNLASKYATLFMAGVLTARLNSVDTKDAGQGLWEDSVINETQAAFHDIHSGFLAALAKRSNQLNKDQSGTTATIMLVKPDYYVIASLGDSRAVLSTRQSGLLDGIQLTRDHTASNPKERQDVENRGGFVKVMQNGVSRVNGTLVVSRSIGDESLAEFLSQTPDVFPFLKDELVEKCGELKDDSIVPCFVILASDGLWDTVENKEAVTMVSEIVTSASSESSWIDSYSLQLAAEALVQEAYVRGSTDNIGVCVVALT